MKCSKCGSPLIPNSDFCKICGEKAEPRIEPNVEIIDFESVELEVETTETIIEEIVEPIAEQVEESVEPTIEEETLVEEPIIENEKEPVKPLEEAIEKYLEEMIPTPKNKFNLFPIILLVLLLSSVGLNIYLYIGNSNKVASKVYNKEEKVVTKDISYNSYLFTVLNDWKYKVDNDNNLLFIYDNSEDFGISVQIINEVDYDLLIESELATYMKEHNFQFTSSYEKSINNKEMYLYKGKYGEYNTYLIFTRIANNIMGITKLMFESEVNDVVLNKVLEMNGSITVQEPTIFINDKFNFTDLSQPIITKSNELKESDK